MTLPPKLRLPLTPALPPDWRRFVLPIVANILAQEPLYVLP